MFRQDVSCPALLEDHTSDVAVRGYHPSCQAFQPVPLSQHVATGLIRVRSPTTDGVSLMSFPRGTEMFQFPRFAFGTYEFSSKYLRYDRLPVNPCPPDRSPITCITDRRGHGMRRSKVGFPIRKSEGSKPVRGSPRLIAAYHVLHRLSAPRHPPDTLMTLDRSHYRCPPPGDSDQDR